MTEQQVSKEWLNKVRMNAEFGVKDTEPGDVIRLVDHAVQQEQAREAAYEAIDASGKLNQQLAIELGAAVARAESLELSLRTACAERDAALAVVAQVREYANGKAVQGRALGDFSMERAGLDLLIILDAAAPEGEK